MDGPTMVRALIDRGYSPVQAAALAGHAIQESGGDPTNVNKNEDAHGLLQWRLDRWDNLRKFAADRGTDPTDSGTQLDFIGHEMRGSEARAGKGFLSAADIPTASAALKPYIRWGDDSDQTRTNNALRLAGQPIPEKASLPTRSASASSPVAPAPVGSAPGQAIGPDETMQALAGIPKQLAQAQAADAPAPLQLIDQQPVVTPAMQRARQLAQIMLARGLNPGSMS